MILFRYFPWGGMQQNFLRISQACLERGYQVDVYTLDWQGECPEGLNVNLLEVAAYSNISRYSKFIQQLRPLLARQSYDLVMGFNRMPGLDLYYAADPCFVERIRKTRPWYYRYTPRYRHFQEIEKQVFEPGSDTRVLALSELQIEDYTRHYGTQRERFILLPPGVQARYRKDKNAISLRQSLRGKHGISADGLVVLMIGSGFARKGIDRGLRAVAALPEALRSRCHIFVIGKGREKPLRRLARRLRLDNRLYIVAGSHELPMFMQGADLLLHPARSENTGNVIVEAIAAGLPVLCTATCGYAGHVQQADAGLVIKEPFDQQNMNNLLSEMFEPRKLQGWQKNALEYAEHEDLYSRLEVAIGAIETIADEKLRHA